MNKELFSGVEGGSCGWPSADESVFSDKLGDIFWNWR